VVKVLSIWLWNSRSVNGGSFVGTSIAWEHEAVGALCVCLSMALLLHGMLPWLLCFILDKVSWGVGSRELKGFLVYKFAVGVAGGLGGGAGLGGC